MGFLHWICETYILPKLKQGKRTKRKTINQYWRDFKMLYRRANGVHVDANDSYEIVKVIFNFPLLFLVFLLFILLTLQCKVYQWHTYGQL